MYPDAIISEPPIDLTLTSHKNAYTVESSEKIVPNEASSDSGADNYSIAIVQPERTMQINSQDQISSIAPVVDIRLSANIEPKAAKESVTTSVEPQIMNIINFDVPGDCNMFFRCDYSSIPYVWDYEPTKWSLLCDLFEQLYDLGAKKVIFDENLYCAHFDSISDYQEAFTEMRSRNLKPLEVVDVPKTYKYEFKKKMDRYKNEIPWCLNQELGLCCFVVKIESNDCTLEDDFMQFSKRILGYHECIFFKSVPGEIWIGFTDVFILQNSVRKIHAHLPESDFAIIEPSDELLESINFSDLTGDAYDLAFLSNQLGFKPMLRPSIIDQISLQRMEEKECKEFVFHITVEGDFLERTHWDSLCAEQIVKILVHFSKVIPLAVTLSVMEVNLLYNSWHEAHTAGGFLRKLTKAEVPYFRDFRRTSFVRRQQLDCRNISDYYIINDQRKVLEKIIQNKNQVNKLDSNSSTVQSTTDIDASDEEMIKKLQYSFVITTNSDFKFTSGMISIIKMNLVQMDCPACIEFDDKIWVGVDGLEKGKIAETRMKKIKFKILHEKDEYDFEFRVKIQCISRFPPKVTKMLADKLRNPTPMIDMNSCKCHCKHVPLGHFNYNYRKAVEMSTSQYLHLNEYV
uniref:Uncharacterized protein n=1 Tax=Tetranychus urticae TaxID=32264 RepID=A0A158P523_TETUR